LAATRNGKSKEKNMSKTIVITGATAGIGRDAALHFARQGHTVFAAGRRRPALESLEQEAAASGGTIHGLVLDVTDAASIARALEEVQRRAGRIDVLVNNAGYGQTGPLEELSDGELRAQFETNVFGLMAMTRAFLPLLRAAGGGHILNVSSVGGRTTMPLFGAYHASKYAVEALSDALRYELHSAGIKVVLIEPGPIRTEFGDVAVSTLHRSSESPYAAGYARADWFKQFSDKQAVGPEKVTRVMERAISTSRPAARYVVPFTSRLALWLAAVVPQRLYDAMMRWATGLHRPRLSVAGSRPQLGAHAS
jgi:NAD(P)-dependent dehydrogenase (short-subunit alcohol dehydrogenase family)